MVSDNKHNVQDTHDQMRHFTMREFINLIIKKDTHSVSILVCCTFIKVLKYEILTKVQNNKKVNSCEIFIRR